MSKSYKKHFKKISEDIGTPSHIDFLRTNDERRHKSRCIYYDKSDKKCYCGKCGNYLMKCSGSSHCNRYDDNPNHLE